MSTTQVDLDLIRKYNVPGPRYTSYPPATQFKETLTWPELESHIVQSNDSGRDLSLYFHLPFCESLCWFCGCTTVITTQRQQSADYLGYLEKEMAQMKPLLDSSRQAAQLHLGGGTPTFLSPAEIHRLGDLIHAAFGVRADAEAGVEVDPRRLTRDHMSALRDIGFNRVSMGVQDNQEIVQKAVHRIQPFAVTQQAVDWARETGFQSLNIDLIYGLPYQTVASFETTLEEILTLNPDRLAVFNYAHVPWIKPAQKIFKEDALPSPDTKLQLLKLTIEKLTSEGYIYIGMDHFARANDELAEAQRNKTLQRNFQGYSTRGHTDIFAFGMSSISQIPDAYWQNFKELEPYYAALDAGGRVLARGCVLNRDDQIRRETIMRLMCDMALDHAAMSESLGVNFPSYFANELEAMADLASDGLVITSSRGLEVTEIGRLLIRNIAMLFDHYLPKKEERRFSKTI